MQVTVNLSGLMEVSEAGKKGSGAHVLNFLGGSIYLTPECCTTSLSGPVKEAVVLGEIRKAEFGFNVQPIKVTLK